MTKYCSKCDQVIKPGEKYMTHGVDSGSAAAPPVYWHEVCPPAPRR